MIGRDSFQEADIIGITTPITKHNYQLRGATEIPETVKTAFYIATTGRPGPVLIDIPKNTQTEVAEIEFSDKIVIRGYKPTFNPHPLQIRKAAELLAEAEKPVILAGGGVITSNASAELLQTSELLLAPVATTFMGKGAFPEIHPLSLGSIGMHGNPVANKLLCEADVLLAVGTRFSDRATGNLDRFCSPAKKIHIDVDTAEIGKNVEVEIPIVADAKKALKALHSRLAKQLKKKENSAWIKRVKEAKEQLNPPSKGESKDLKPKALLRQLRKLLPEDAIVTTEVGQNQMWAALYFNAVKPRTFISSGGLGTMGFGMVAQWQRMFFEKRYVAVKLGSTPDFVKLAEAYGAQGFRVGSIREFSKAIKEALKSNVTTVIDVPISSEEDVAPMVPPGCGINQEVGDY
jgi:acetolactate synthase-1/2/3 large subunit